MIAPEPRPPAESEILSIARYLVDADQRYGRSSATVGMVFRRLAGAVEQLDEERRRQPPARRRLEWDVAKVVSLFGLITGSIILWALAGAGLAYIAQLLGWL